MTEAAPRVSGIVLAGGRASRFGGPKLSAQLEGRSLLDLSIEAVLAIADEVIVVGPADGTLEVTVQPAVTLARDRTPYPGPLAGLAEGLAVAREPRSIVVGGDMPRLRPALLRSLVDRLDRPTRCEAAILARASSEPVQVLPLALRVDAARRAAAEALSSGRSSLRALLERLDRASIAEAEWRAIDPDAASLLDVDAPDDLARIDRRRDA